MKEIRKDDNGVSILKVQIDGSERNFNSFTCFVIQGLKTKEEYDSWFQHLILPVNFRFAWAKSINGKIKFSLKRDYEYYMEEDPERVGKLLIIPRKFVDLEPTGRLPRIEEEEFEKILSRGESVNYSAMMLFLQSCALWELAISTSPDGNPVRAVTPKMEFSPDGDWKIGM